MEDFEKRYERRIDRVQERDIVVNLYTRMNFPKNEEMELTFGREI